MTRNCSSYALGNSEFKTKGDKEAKNPSKETSLNQIWFQKRRKKYKDRNLCLLQGWSRKSLRLHRVDWPTMCSLQWTPRAQLLARKPSNWEPLGSPAAREPGDRGLAASIPCLPSSHQPARGRKEAGKLLKLGGEEDVILHLPGFWEDSIKMDMFSVCFNVGVLDFAMPDKYARKFLTSCTVNTEHQHLPALAQSIFPMNGLSNLRSKLTHLDSDVPMEFIQRWLLQTWAVGTWEAGQKPVTASEGWIHTKVCRGEMWPVKSLLYAWSSR